MTEQQAEELYQLLGKQVFKYTSGDSTSVSVETAQKILKSMDYCINSYYKSLENPAPYGGQEQLSKMSTQVVPLDVKEKSLEEIFELGVQAVQRCVQTSKELLVKIQDSYITVDNVAYRDTVKTGLNKFFATYQPRFAAHLGDAEIDYPLAVEVEDLDGVEFMYEYLRRLYFENLFLQKFDSEDINSLLRGYHKDASEYLINIFELVLQNSLGLSFLSQNVLDLNITLYQQEELFHLLKGKSIVELSQLLTSHANQVLTQLDLARADMITYVETKIKELAYRLHQNLNLNNLTYTFVMFDREYQPTQAYFEGEMMPDEDLRRLIEEMQAMRHLNDKLILLKEQIHSLSDLKEVLGECFAGDEYHQVFRLLLPQEIDILVDQAKANLTFYDDETMLTEWERALLNL
jgi:hypothetical protein